MQVSLCRDLHLTTCVISPPQGHLTDVPTGGAEPRDRASGAARSSPTLGDSCGRVYGLGEVTPSDRRFYVDLHVEAELHDVAVLHDVVLALHAPLPGGLGRSHRPRLDQVVEGHDLSLDEAALE